METKQKQSVKQNNPEKKEEKIDDWRTRINWEKIHRTVAIVVICLIPFFIRDMTIFREAIKEEGHQMFNLNYMGKVAISTLVFTLVRKIYFISTHSFILSKILPQYTGNDRVLHAKKVQKWTFDFLYYTATTIYGFVCFRNATWYPLSLIQKEEDDTLGLLKQWPNMPVDQAYFKYFETFLIVQFGHHTWGVLDLYFRRKTENRFYEWVLHHILAWTLIFYSSYFNFQILAVSVLLIHDVGDIFIVMFKTYGEFSNKGIAFKYLVFQMISGWFLSRVYMYPKVIIYPIIVYKRLHENDRIFQIANAAYIYQTIMLSILYLLHMYWFAQMITLLTTYIRKSMKEGRVKKNKQEGYGNEWDYYHYNEEEKKKLKEKQNQEQQQQQQQAKEQKTE